MSDSVTLRIVYDLQGFGIVVTDCETEETEQFYFGDEQWEAEGCSDLEDTMVSLQWIAGVNWTKCKAEINHSDEAGKPGLIAENSGPISRDQETPPHWSGRQTGYLLN